MGQNRKGSQRANVFRLSPKADIPSVYVDGTVALVVRALQRDHFDAPNLSHRSPGIRLLRFRT
jgi:hypothetical protein